MCYVQILVYALKFDDFAVFAICLLTGLRLSKGGYLLITLIAYIVCLFLPSMGSI